MPAYELLGIVAALVGFMSYPAYMLHMRTANIRPNRVTWVVFAAVNWVIALSYHSAGGGWSSLMPFGFAVGSSTLAVLSLFKGEGGASTFDRWCVVAAAIAYGLWLAAKPVWGMAFGLAAGAIGTFPTLRKLYCTDNRESFWSWSLAWLSSSINLVGALITPETARQASLTTVVTPMVFYIVQVSTVLGFILWQQWIRPTR